jgi:hypothetical protein
MIVTGDVQSTPGPGDRDRVRRSIGPDHRPPDARRDAADG